MKQVLACLTQSIALVSLSATFVISGGFNRVFATSALADTLAVDEQLNNHIATSCLPAVEGPAVEGSDLFTTSGLMLLTPEGMGQTISTQPTFFWFSQATSTQTPTQFRLYEYDEARETYVLMAEGESTPERNEAGVMALALPREMATLSVGQRYLWQVEVVCDDNAADNLVAAAEFEVVEPSSKVMSDLIAANTMAERTSILASESLWYDALFMMFLATATDDVTQDMVDVRRSLLEQVAEATTNQAELERSPVIRQDLVLIPIR